MGSGASKRLKPLGKSVLSTYEIDSSFTYVDRHCIYSDSTATLDAIPVPRQPSIIKSVLFELDEFTEIDQRAEQTPNRLLDRPYEELIKYLTNGLEGDLAKIRVLYRWITAQPVDMMLAPRSKPNQNRPIYHIWRIKNSEGNYSQWFAALCRLVNIPCVIVHGRLKGSSYQVGEDVNDDDHYGEWNAVLIDGSWRFVDSYWGACASIEDYHDVDDVPVEDEELIDPCIPKDDVKTNTTTDNKGAISRPHERVTSSKVRQMSKIELPKTPIQTLSYTCVENYFLSDPKEMIYSHYPETEAWQLLDDPWTIQKFVSCANVKDRFFELGMTLDSHKKCVIDSESGDVEILLGIPVKEGLNFKFQFILYKMDSNNKIAPQYNRNVFMHRPVEKSLSLTVRAPSSGIYRLELVGRDVRTLKPNYDYDWIVTYKLKFKNSSESRLVFPEHPDSGWGPASHTQMVGLFPISNKTGLVKTTTSGDAQISFEMSDPEKFEDALLTAHLYDSNDREIPNTVVYRLEKQKLIFNLKTPRKGEYSLRLYLEIEDGTKENFCNYLVISYQRHGVEIFPEELGGRIGQRKECERVGLKPTSNPSAVISTDVGELTLTFEYFSDDQLYHSFVANNKFDSIHCFEDTKDDRMVTYTLSFPKSGVYGFKLGAKAKDKEEINPLIDYVITYSSGLPSSSSLSIHSEESEEDVLKRAILIAVDAQDEDELEVIRRKLKKKTKESWAAGLLAIVESELDVLRTANRLVEALNFRHIERTRDALRYIKEKNYTERMINEVRAAEKFINRHEHIVGLLHAVLDLDKNTVSEIRAYTNPPEIVHKTIMATLLLLGYFEDDTSKWSQVQIIMGKTGSESIKRQIQAFDINVLQLDVAVGAKKLLGEITLDDIRIKSAGAAAFFVWTKGVINETETRHKEEMERTLPRTRKKKAKKKVRKQKTILDRAKDMYS